MKNLILLPILVSGLLILSIKGQKSAGALDRTKPTVYVELVSDRAPEYLQSSSDDELIWLRIKNNSRSGIRLDVSGGRSTKLKDVRLYYDILDRSETLIEKNRCHVCSSNILRPRESLLFAVPRESVSENRSVRIKFSFEWENDLKVAAGEEPSHYVVFDGRDLPK